MARFLSTDPWADKYPSWSTYNYVMGNPVILIDPTGKGAESVLGGPGKKPPGDGKDGDDKGKGKGKGDGKGHNQPKYIPPPKELPGFPGAEKLPNKKGMRPGVETTKW